MVYLVSLVHKVSLVKKQRIYEQSESLSQKN
jgi:hypothetical protein